MGDRIRAFFADPPDWFRVMRSFPAYHAFNALHWLYFKLLPYAGEWAYRERPEPKCKGLEARHVAD